MSENNHNFGEITEEQLFEGKLKSVIIFTSVLKIAQPQAVISPARAYGNIA